MTSAATPAGFHYLQLFQCCPRRWYLRHVQRLRPRFTPVPLVNGTLFHAAKACFYATGSEKKALALLSTQLREARGEIAEAGDYELMRLRLPHMLSAWIARYGLTDLKRYTFLSIEREYTLRFSSGYFATVRPDAVVRDAEGSVFILETKTTGFSANLTEVSVAMGDQATTQIAAVAAAHPRLHILGVLPDIVFWLKSSRKPADIHCQRGDLITRTVEELQQWREGTEALHAEISAKVAALRTHSEYALFPRNTDYCISYSHPCEYLHICRAGLDLKRTVPHGFVRAATPAAQRKTKGKRK